MEKEKVLEATPKTSISSLDRGTPPLPQHQTGNQEHRKICTSDRLRVPKAFKYPERYTSPTDQMMSPVSKGLLARSKKGVALLLPFKNQSKIQDLQFKDVGVAQS